MPDESKTTDRSETTPDPGASRPWRSLSDANGASDPRARLAAEFPEAFRPEGVDRRALLRVMAASLSLGALGACGEGAPGTPLISRPRLPEGYRPGRPVVFATTLPHDGLGQGVLVASGEGRPFKVEGNPLHPASLGASDVFMQASVLSLYDPDRSHVPRENGAPRSWADLEGLVRPQRSRLAMERGRGLAILVEPVPSPTRRRMLDAVAGAYPEARFFTHDPLPRDAQREGARLAFGRPLDVVPDVAAADVVLCLGGDLFLETPGHIRHAADLIARRREGPGNGRPAPRFHVAESRLSLAGARADRRIVLHPAEIEAFAHAVYRGVTGGAGSPSDPPDAAGIAAELAAAGSRALVVVGREQPASVHALACAVLARLGAFGTTARLIEPLTVHERAGSLEDLAGAMASGTVSHLLVLGGNPVYTAPADLDLAALIRRVPVSVHLGTGYDETAAACRWHIPRRHIYESWGDVAAFDGTVGLIQPVAEPAVPLVSPEEALGLLLGQPVEPRNLVRQTWAAHLGDEGDAAWIAAADAGILPNSAAAPVEASLRADFDPGPMPQRAMPQGTVPQRATPALTAIFAPDASVWDGSYADNAWLQELPRPLTKLVWGNAALMAPATLAALGLRDGDVVRLTAGAASVEAPVHAAPGHAPAAVTLPLGYGRARAGRVGTGVGFDSYGLRTREALWTVPVSVEPVGRRHPLVSTQDHHGIDDERIVRIVAAGDAVAEPSPPPSASLYESKVYDDRAWAMAIDLDACIGCNACMAACQAENNVPVVGVEEVSRGREMHWLRVDRYHVGDPAEPRTVFQPVPCMHCEKAPCEVVCPVNATVHSHEGLNDMVYNRCIGTRTCSNNCPYKVRRFNWFDYADQPLNEAVEPNPQVSVRARGVMEKCTYCVQRISAARIEARIEDRPIRDGDVRTACQQACPTQAIVFGDANDPETAVSRLRRSPRHYAMLGHLDTRPRTTYLARVDAAAVREGDG